MKIFFYLLALYLLYKLIFRFIIPVYKTTSQVKKKIKEMQEQQQFGQQRFEQQQQKQEKPPSNPTSRGKEDYIDFEDVK